MGFTAPNRVTVAFSAAFLDFTQINGILPVAKGGTGATSGAQALINLIGGSPSANEVLVWNGTAWVPGSGDSAFSDITSGVNTSSTMTVGSGASLVPSGAGVIQASQIQAVVVSATPPTVGQALVATGSAAASWQTIDASFSGILSGINTTATMTVGGGATLTFAVTGSPATAGVVDANQLYNVAISSIAPTAGQVLTAASSSAASWQTVSNSFSAITSGTNDAATMTVGPGAVLTFSGAGSPPSEGEINANFLYGVQISGSAPTTGQVLTATSATSANWQATPTGAQTFGAVGSKWVNSYTSSTGLFTATQPAASDLSNGVTGTGAVVLASALSGFGTTNTIASGTVTLGGGSPPESIASGAASSVTSVAATGVLSTDNVMADFNGNPLSIVGFVPSVNGMLTVVKWCSSGDVNFALVNNTAGTINPGIVTLNWRVVR